LEHQQKNKKPNLLSLAFSVSNETAQR